MLVPWHPTYKAKPEPVMDAAAVGIRRDNKRRILLPLASNEAIAST